MRIALSFLPALMFAFLPAFVNGQHDEPKDKLPSAPEGKSWKMVWHDEFDGDKLDETKWDVPPDGKRRDAWWMRKAISLDGKGNLAISTFKEGDRYIDGCVRTKNKFEHAFGYYIARIRLQKQPGSLVGLLALQRERQQDRRSKVETERKSIFMKSRGSMIVSSKPYTGMGMAKSTSPRAMS